MLQNNIRLDDLLARDLAVQWFEGVSLVQSISAQVLSGGGSGSGFPSLSQVFLGGDGTVAIHGIPSGSNSVQMAAHTLAQMVGDDAPVRLRLFITQATGAEPGSMTLEGFSQELAYFERPDPASVLQGLHDRAVAAPSRQEARFDTATPQAPAREKERQDPSVPKPRSRGLVVAGTIGLVVCASIWLLALRSDAGPIDGAITKLENAVRSTLGGDAPSSPPEVPEDLEKGGSAKGSRKGAPSLGSKPARRQPGTAAAAAKVAPVPHVMSPFRGNLLGLTAPPDAVPVFYSSIEVPAMEASDLASGIYSEVDSRVVPPKSVYPKLPANPPSAVRLPDQTGLEMIVGTDGLVERVRLRTSPRNVHEFMLLSAAKAWQFEPATLEGYPVRFRHSVVLTLN